METTSAGAPAVVAIVVTHDPGEWFDEALASLAAQDYPNFAVLVVDTASQHDPAPRVARQLPDAFVKRIETNTGYGSAINDAIEVVDGAAFFLLLHDDVALAPDSVRTMVEEAYRSNAGVVGPKLVTWSDGSRLLSVGESIDKSGTRSPLTERYELDQEQHDAVRDVFVIPGAAMLIRSDLFATIGGYDSAIDFHNDDLAVCWRAHLAGARVVVTPDAVARHVEALGDRQPVEDRRRLQNVHRMRSVLICYSRIHLLRVLPQIALITVVEVIYALLIGRTRQAKDLVAGWTVNLRSLGAIRAERREVQGFRTVPDSEIRNLQVRGSARFGAFLRGQLGGADEDRLKRATAASRDLAASLQRGPAQTAIVAWALVVLVVAFGTRQIVTDLPAIGEFSRFDDSAFDMLRTWASGWRNTGLGSESPNPSVLGLAGATGLASLGSMGLARQLLTVGLLPVGLLGGYRLLASTGSRRAQSAALVAMAAIPVPYFALAEGRWGALALWAASPWLLIQLGRASGLAPFVSAGADAPRLRRPALALGVFSALVTMVLPVAAFLIMLVAGGLMVGSVIAGAPRGGTRMAAASGASAAVTFVLHLPWSLDFVLPGAEWSAFVGPDTGSRSLEVIDLVGLGTGSLPVSILGFGVLVAGGLSLLIGRGWRFEWAARGWAVALGSMACAVVADRELIGFALPPAEVLLAPGAAGLAMAVGLGVVAFELDLSAYQFGWRQLAAAAAGGALAVGSVPVIFGAFDGSWSQPGGDHHDVLGFLETERAETPFRVLWLGRPDALPLGSYEVDEGLAFATTDHGLPDLSDRFVAASSGPASQVADAIDLARDGGTTRVGRVLAPLSVRYVIVVGQLAPAPFDNRARPVPAGVVASLAAQLDLEQLEVNPALAVFRNAESVPLRADVAAGFGEGLTVTDVAAVPAVSGGAVLTTEEGRTTFRGEVEAGAHVFWGVDASDNWELTVDGGPAASSTAAFGFGSVYTVDTTGTAELTYRTPLVRYGIVFIQVILWLIALRSLLSYRLGARLAPVDIGGGRHLKP